VSQPLLFDPYLANENPRPHKEAMSFNPSGIPVRRTRGKGCSMGHYPVPEGITVSRPSKCHCICRARDGRLHPTTTFCQQTQHCSQFHRGTHPLQSCLGLADTSPIVLSNWAQLFCDFFETDFFFSGPQDSPAKRPKSLVDSLDRKSCWLLSSCATFHSSPLATTQCLS